MRVTRGLRLGPTRHATPASAARGAVVGVVVVVRGTAVVPGTGVAVGAATAAVVITRTVVITVLRRVLLRLGSWWRLVGLYRRFWSLCLRLGGLRRRSNRPASGTTITSLSAISTPVTGVARRRFLDERVACWSNRGGQCCGYGRALGAAGSGGLPVVAWPKERRDENH